MIQLVYATNVCGETGNFGFGYKNGLPWGHVSKDLTEFKRTTEGTVLVMGVNTFQSLPFKLPNRKHIVICDPQRTEELPSCGNNGKPDKIRWTLEEALKTYNKDYSIIGGPKLLSEGYEVADRIVHTKIMERKLSPADVWLDLTIRIDQFYLDKCIYIYHHKEPNIKSIIVDYYNRKE